MQSCPMKRTIVGICNISTNILRHVCGKLKSKEQWRMTLWKDEWYHTYFSHWQRWLLLPQKGTARKHSWNWGVVKKLCRKQRIINQWRRGGADETGWWGKAFCDYDLFLLSGCASIINLHNSNCIKLWRIGTNKRRPRSNLVNTNATTNNKMEKCYMKSDLDDPHLC